MNIKHFITFQSFEKTASTFSFGFWTPEGVAIHKVSLPEYQELKKKYKDDGFLILEDGHAVEFQISLYKKNTVLIGRFLGEVA